MRNAQNKRDSSNTNTGIREWSSSGLLVVHQLIRLPRGYYNCYIELFQLFHIREKSLPEPPVKSGNLGKLLNKLIFPPPKLIIERWPYFCWHHHYKNCLLRGDGEFFSQKISLTSKSFFRGNPNSPNISSISGQLSNWRESSNRDYRSFKYILIQQVTLLSNDLKVQ